MATKARRSSAKKKSARSAKKRCAGRKSTMRASARRGAKAASKRRTPARRAKAAVARVKRVTRDVVQQATVAVTSGVETLRGLGENLVDRVRA